MSKHAIDLVSAHTSGEKKSTIPSAITLPGRANKVFVGGYFTADVRAQLKLLGVERQQTVQQMLADALNDYFAKNGKPELAPVEE